METICATATQILMDVLRNFLVSAEGTSVIHVEDISVSGLVQGANQFADCAALITEKIGILCPIISDINHAKPVSILERMLREAGYDILLCCTDSVSERAFCAPTAKTSSAGISASKIRPALMKSSIKW